jgi:hypothetical protein
MDTGSVRGVLAGVWLAASVGVVGLAPAAPADAQTAPARAADDPLTAEIRAVDSAMFAAFNTCDQPGQLDKYMAFYAPDIEFYHDNGGLMVGLAPQRETTRTNVCGHFSRELLPGTLQVFPIKDFGAVSRGSHRFCQFDTGQCAGEADFLILWKRTPAGFKATRVVSFGPPRHHAGGAVAGDADGGEARAPGMSVRDPRYDPLFEPIRIGPVTAKNRFFQVPHCNGMGHAMPQAHAAMREVKAEGGWAVVSTEECEIHPSGDVSPYVEARLWDDHDIPALQLMCEKVHAHGALAAIELTHNGPTASNLYSREVLLAPSHQPSKYGYPNRRAR